MAADIYIDTHLVRSTGTKDLSRSGSIAAFLPQLERVCQLLPVGFFLDFEPPVPPTIIMQTTHCGRKISAE